MSHRRAVLSAVFALAVALPGHAPAQPAEVLAFDILRNGRPIGSHVYTIRDAGEVTEVEVRTEIDYRLGFLPLYTFRHQSTEVWQGDRLVRMRSRTDDNGTDREVAVARGAAGLDVSVDGRPPRPVGEAVPASLWNPVTAAGGVFLDTVDGSVMRVRAQRPEPRHVRLDGDLERDVWYDGGGRLERVRFTAGDGSEIAYRLRREEKAEAR